MKGYKFKSRTGHTEYLTLFLRCRAMNIMSRKTTMIAIHVNPITTHQITVTILVPWCPQSTSGGRMTPEVVTELCISVEQGFRTLVVFDDNIDNDENNDDIIVVVVAAIVPSDPPSVDSLPEVDFSSWRREVSTSVEFSMISVGFRGVS